MGVQRTTPRIFLGHDLVIMIHSVEEVVLATEALGFVPGKCWPLAAGEQALLATGEPRAAEEGEP